ncbi:RNA exonuclease 3 isoform X2 [Dendroctonus ponderosae]|nr:RNA exonuclease 3 isoform X2 [Dendroctonus ponderosae]
MLVTLKGHTGRVLDMDFSANEKYLASSADEEPDKGEKLCFKRNKRKLLQRRQKKTILCSSSSNSSLDLCASPSNPSSPTRTTGLTRRQRKNQLKKNRVGKLVQNNKNKMEMPWDHYNFLGAEAHNYYEEIPYQNQNSLLTGMQEDELAEILKEQYVMSEGDMAIYGYPMSKNQPACFINPSDSRLDINAAEFVPESESSSGNYSGTTTEDELCDVEEEVQRQVGRSIGAYPAASYHPQQEHVCVRCGSKFVTQGGRYLTEGTCRFHPGKLRNRNSPFGPMWYTCCRLPQHTLGCEVGPCHVWNGPTELVVDELFVETEERPMYYESTTNLIFALDCEMSYTAAGLEVVKVAVLNCEGVPIYVEYIRPLNPIVDYNTRFSGIVAEDFINNSSKTLKEVQKDLKKFIFKDTVLIGHGLENDLKGLKIIHKTVVDTAFTFPHHSGFPFKQSLKYLVQSMLGQSIQGGTTGHDPCEDARSCLLLIIFRVYGDQRFETDCAVDCV